MKIVVHICSFNGKNYKERFSYLKKIVQSYNEIDKNIQVFIHTNKITSKYKVKKANYILHNLKNENPFYLAWKCRPLIEKQKNEFDYFIYSEDDILFTKKNFKYWLDFKDICLKHNYNLGFLRIEKKDKSFSTDLFQKMKYKTFIKGKKFVVNNINNYCAFWIYDKIEINNFINTKYWKFKWKGKSMYAFYGIREMSAIGWHGKNMSRYIATVIPLYNEKLNSGCYINHLSNNHALSNHPVGFGSIEKTKIINKTLKDFSIVKKEFYIFKYLRHIFRKIY